MKISHFLDPKLSTDLACIFLLFVYMSLFATFGSGCPVKLSLDYNINGATYISMIIKSLLKGMISGRAIVVCA